MRIASDSSVFHWISWNFHKTSAYKDSFLSIKAKVFTGVRNS